VGDLRIVVEELLPTPALTLLPTPACNDMGEGKTVEHWDEWTAAMQAKHGNGNGHGKSLAIEAQRLLPTPTTEPTTGNGHARDLSSEIRLLPTPKATNNENQQTPRDGAVGYGLNLGMALESIGANMPPPSPDGNASSDAERLPLPRQDPKADSD